MAGKKSVTIEKTEGVIADIPPLVVESATFHLRGTAPLCQHRFSEEAQQMMRWAQEQGSRSKKGGKREPKDFEAQYKGAMYVSTEGWHGIPASTFRNAAISACRIVGFVMTRAKLGLWCVADGMDAKDGTPLVRITKGEPEMWVTYVRLPGPGGGVADLASRPLWKEWEVNLTMGWDKDMFSVRDVANLVNRVGKQVGIGPGRPDSKTSNGIGLGLFDIVSE